MSSFQALCEAVYDELGRDEYLAQTLQEVTEHGADCGFGGFIYYHETVDFFRANHAAIVQLVEDTAEQLETNPIALVLSFRTIEGNFNYAEVAAALLSSDDCEVMIANALAWFALEEVAHHAVHNENLHNILTDFDGWFAQAKHLVGA